MSEFLEKLKEMSDMTYTENGAVTNKSSGSDCLDFFASIGGMRNRDEQDIIKYFIRAYAEDPDKAMKLLFYTRDIRGGLGERRIFRVILRWLAEYKSESVIINLPYIPEYGRYDDLLVLIGTRCEKNVIAMIKKQLTQDIEALEKGEEVSLLAKWLPSVCTSNKEAVRTAKYLARSIGMSEAEYRKTLSKLRAAIRIIETKLCKKEYDFDYSKQCSKALYKYRKAFIRNDNERYMKYIEDVNAGKTKMNTSTLMPYELVEPYLKRFMPNPWQTNRVQGLSAEETESLNTTWANLPDYGSDENMIAVIDTSGSMYWNETMPSPGAVALSLGLYIAERNRGAFANHFIEFSFDAELIEIKGNTFADRLLYTAGLRKIANTDLEAVFETILATALKYNMPQSEMPAKLIIISDMEFDFCVTNAGLTNFENAKKCYELHGYKLPEVIFWNVACRNRQVPVKKNEQGVALVSGCTPLLFEMTAGGIVSPEAFMEKILSSERYKTITSSGGGGGTPAGNSRFRSLRSL